MNQNGKHTLDLTDFIEPAHIITPTAKFDLPMDMDLALQHRIEKMGRSMEAAGESKDSSEADFEMIDTELWRLADKLLENAVPRPEGSAREVFVTRPAIFRLIGFLRQGYLSIQSSSVPSPAPTPTTEPSPSETSLTQAPS